MAKSRTFVILVFALILGMGAAWLANKWLQLQIQPAEANGQLMTSVAVASAQISMGQRLDEATVKMIEWPVSNVPEGAFQNLENVVGKVAKENVYPGEPLLEYRVVDKLEGSTLSAIIEPKMRAVTVRVNDVVGVAGFILPGNRVDVLATRKTNGLNANAKTRTLLQNLRVLAVDQSATSNKDHPVIVRAVTLEATPKSALKLIEAANEGPIQLVLRNTLDDSKVVQEKVKPKVVVKTKKVYVQAKAQPEPEFLTVIRGTKVNRVEKTGDDLSPNEE